MKNVFFKRVLNNKACISGRNWTKSLLWIRTKKSMEKEFQITYMYTNDTYVYCPLLCVSLWCLILKKSCYFSIVFCSWLKITPKLTQCLVGIMKWKYSILPLKMIVFSSSKKNAEVNFVRNHCRDGQYYNYQIGFKKRHHHITICKCIKATCCTP